MVLTSENRALTTRRRLDEENAELNDNAVVVRIVSQPIDRDSVARELVEYRRERKE